MKKSILFSLAIIFSATAARAQTAQELLERGRGAYMNYDFNEAGRLYAQAKKKGAKAGAEFNEQYEKYSSQLSTAKNFLNRVEKIAIIDSISVPRDEFFRNYRLPASAGILRGAEALPTEDESVDYVFSNEGEDYLLWARTDSIGRYRLVESTLLTDGNWSEPSQLSDDLSEDGDERFPFMMADGVTLYYADNGENSIGGYDIMVATRDATDGTFLQPQNLGFPYNSPYDDYLLAIDELNGVGWWATDRNQLDDELTVYIFVVNDLRTNYDSEEEDVTGFARIDDYLATQPEDADYDELLATIRAIDPSEASKQIDFILPAGGGVIYTSYDDLPSQGARSAMERYQDALLDLQESERDLRDLRMEYHDRKQASLASRIKSAETEIETERREVARLRSELYRILK